MNMDKNLQTIISFPSLYGWDSVLAQKAVYIILY